MVPSVHSQRFNQSVQLAILQLHSSCPAVPLNEVKVSIACALIGGHFFSYTVATGIWSDMCTSMAQVSHHEPHAPCRTPHGEQHGTAGVAKDCTKHSERREYVDEKGAHPRLCEIDHIPLRPK